MTISEFLVKTSYALRGIDDEAPVFGTDESNYWVSLLDRKIKEWATDPRQSWSNNFKNVETSTPTEPGTVSTSATTTLTGTSTYFLDYQVGDKITVSGETERTIATISSDTSLTVTVAFSNTASGKTFTRKTIIKVDTQDYNLHRRLVNPSDNVIVTTTDDQDVIFNFAEPQSREYYNSFRQVYISGVNPQILTFKNDIETGDQIIGGTLKVPGFYLPVDISAETDVIPIDDPYWAVYAVAEEIALNDIIYEDKVGNLNAKANALWNKMASLNRRGTYASPRTIPTSVNRIGSTRSVRSWSE